MDESAKCPKYKYIHAERDSLRATIKTQAEALKVLANHIDSFASDTPLAVVDAALRYREKVGE